MTGAPSMCRTRPAPGRSPAPPVSNPDVAKVCFTGSTRGGSRLLAGYVFVNCHSAAVLDQRAPFGGVALPA